MTDTTLYFNAGGGGDKASADLIGTVKHLRVKIQTGDTGTATDVGPSNPLSIGITSPLETTARGGTGIPVFVQDQTTGVLDLPFLQDLGAITLAADTVVGSRNITLTAGHGLTTGANARDIIELADSVNGSHFMQTELVTVTGDVILLDSPVNRIYTAASDLVGVSKRQMNVDGSTTPQIFDISPLPQQSGDITRIICELRDTVAMDFETFGGIPALTNGLVLRVNNGDGTYRHIANFKSNGSIIQMCFDHSFATNNGGGTRAFTARLSFAGQEKHGVAVRLDGAVGTGERLELIVQDDLTGLTRMQWMAQGSEVQN